MDRREAARELPFPELRSGRVPRGAACIAVAAAFVLLAGCATRPPVRPPENWFSRLPSGSLYLYLDVQRERGFLADTAAALGKEKDVKAVLSRAGALYGQFDFGEARPGTAADAAGPAVAGDAADWAAGVLDGPATPATPESDAARADDGGEAASAADEPGTPAAESEASDADNGAPAEPAHPAPKITANLIATGNFPASSVRFSLGMNREWKKKGPADAAWWENADRLQIAVPENGTVYLSTGGMEGFLADAARTPAADRPGFPPEFLARCGTSPVAVYIARPADFLAAVLPVRLGLPVKYGIISFQDAGKDLTGRAVFVMGSPREAVIYGNLVRLALGIGLNAAGTGTGGQDMFDLSGATLTTDGDGIVISGLTVAKGALAARIAASARTAKGNAK